MTKTLTEQWREGTLPAGEYYVKDSNGVEQDGYYPESRWERGFVNHAKHEVKEVLEPVPDYNSLCELKQELEICKDEKADLYAKLCNALAQLEEANEVIENMKLCMDDKYDYDCVADDVDIYLERYGVK